jgi:DUF438 domain-containing protein
MEQAQLLSTILDNLAEEVVFVDMEHIIRYMNKAARKHYAQYGDIIGNSVFKCHNEQSIQKIKDIFIKLQNGGDQILYSENEKRRIYMCAVCDKTGQMIGYYERYISLL